MKIITFITCFLIALTAAAQNDLEAFEHYKDSLNDNFRGDKLSPLSEMDKKKFNALNFYDFNPALIVNARFEKSENNDELILKTTTQRKPMYVKYGYLHFEIDGKKQRLTVLQSSVREVGSEYYDYLSVMFTDETTGDGSYEVGRYMGLYAPLPEAVVLNFNHTYNPYCAYSNRYSCPIPPSENFMDVRIEAGVKKGFK